jgi:hypothetical protein
MEIFRITARTAAHCISYSALASSSSQAALDAAALFGDTPYGITVTPLQVSK